MADCSQTLSFAMDFFWFHHNIISSKKATPLLRKTEEGLVTTNSIPESPIPDLPLISTDLCLSPPLKNQEAEIDGECRKDSGLSSLVLVPKVTQAAAAAVVESQEAEVDGGCTMSLPPNLGMVPEDELESPESCAQSHSSSDNSLLSTSSDKPYRTRRHRKERTRRSKSLTELEHDELKGFLDLGFTFKKDELNPRMLSMIPGLQSLEGRKEERSVEERVRDKISRPYLSEAWLINRPDSPLLNVRIPRASTGGSDMKKHLRFWARTVAYEIQQVS